MCCIHFLLDWIESNFEHALFCGLLHCLKTISGMQADFFKDIRVKKSKHLTKKVYNINKLQNKTGTIGVVFCPPGSRS
jgi:hypothetical protein